MYDVVQRSRDPLSGISVVLCIRGEMCGWKFNTSMDDETIQTEKNFKELVDELFPSSRDWSTKLIFVTANIIAMELLRKEVNRLDPARLQP